MGNEEQMEKNLDPPTAIKDKNGVLVTEKEQLESLYIETYIDRLKEEQESKF